MNECEQIVHLLMSVLQKSARNGQTSLRFLVTRCVQKLRFYILGCWNFIHLLFIYCNESVACLIYSCSRCLIDISVGTFCAVRGQSHFCTLLDWHFSPHFSGFHCLAWHFSREKRMPFFSQAWRASSTSLFQLPIFHEFPQKVQWTSINVTPQSWDSSVLLYLNC